MDYFQQRFNEDLDSQQYANYTGEYSWSWSGPIFDMYGSLVGRGGLGGQLYNADNPQQPDPDGWNDYMYTFPPENILLQFKIENSEFPSTWLGYSHSPSEFNVAGLKWRLTGIGKRQLDSK
jgi:hypothetical protein